MREVDPESGNPFLSVVVRTQRRRDRSLVEAVRSLLDQAESDLEVVVALHVDEGAPAPDPLLPDELVSVPPSVLRAIVVRGGQRGRPLNAGLDAAQGTYVAFLDDDDLALPGMIGALRRGAEAAPGQVLRSVPLGQSWTADPATGEPLEPSGGPERQFAEHFDLLEHLHRNVTPICSIALPREHVRAASLRFDDDIPVMEDWRMVVQAAMRFGIYDLGEETALYRRTDGGNSSTVVAQDVWEATRLIVVGRFEDGPTMLPPGTVRRLSDARFEREGPPQAVAEVALLQSTLEHYKRHVAALEAAARPPSTSLAAAARRALRRVRQSGG